MKTTIQHYIIIVLTLLPFIIQAQVNATFTVTNTTVCENVNIGFIYNAGNNITACNWDFGDGTTLASCLPNLAHKYDQAGMYNACLTVTDNMGNSDTHCVTLTITEAPDIGFEVVRLDSCTPFMIELRDTANQNQTITGVWTWKWTITSNDIFCDAPINHVITAGDAQPQTYMVQNAGSYNVTLEITNSQGCSDSELKTGVFVAYPPPTASFTHQVSIDCDSTTDVSFTNTSTVCTGDEIYIWDFGDNSDTVIAMNPTHTFTSFGTFPVKLRIKDTVSNCQDSILVNVVVPANDTASFSVMPVSGCKGETIQFTDESQGNAVAWFWDFGDGDTSILQNPMHAYDSVGCFTVTLTVTIDSCVRTYTYPSCILIHDDPVIDYNIVGNNYSCSVPFSVEFDGIYPNNITSVIWDFGDGNTSTDLDPTHIYNIRGTFPITLTATDANGCSTTFTKDTVRIEEIVAGFTADSLTGCTPTVINFTDTSNSPVPITNWEWTFINTTTGVTDMSTDTNPTIAFTIAGNYDVSLKIINQNGCQDSIQLTNYITIGTVPNVAFSVSDTAACVNQSLEFTNLSTPNTANFEWNFNANSGTGNISQQLSPSYIYTNPGQYTVQLRGEINGCADSIQQVILIEDITAGFTVDTTQGCVPATINFTDTSNVASIVSWEWTMTDSITGKTYTSTDANPSIIFDTTGTFSIQLIVINTSGCTDTIIQSNLITIGTYPVLDFVASDTTSCVDNPIQFMASATPSNITNPSWDFGDNNTSNTLNPDHPYITTGDYTISFSAEIDGCRSTVTKTNYIEIIPPVAGFLDSTFCENPLTVELTNTSTGGVTWQWIFGDSLGFSTDENPTFTFSDSGEYNITLIASDGVCTDTVSNQVNLRPPIANFSFSNALPPLANGCFYLPTFDLQFVDSSQNSAVQEWIVFNADSMIISTSLNPPSSMTFDTGGVYTIMLIAFSDNGCSDTSSQTLCISDLIPNGGINDTGNGIFNTGGIGFTGTGGFIGGNVVVINGDTTVITSINNQPIDSTNVDYYTGCVPLTVSFTDSSVAQEDNIVAWTWYFGDGNTSNMQNPSHTYTSPSPNGSVYAVILEVTTAGGITERDTLTTFIQPTQPNASFIANINDPCPGEPIIFNNTSTGNGRLTYDWDFGDGTTFSSYNADTSYTYANTGSYVVTLTVRDQNHTDSTDCFDTFTQTVDVTNTIVSFISDTSQTVCDTLLVSFTNTSTNITNQVTWAWDFGNGITSNLEQPDPVKYIFPGNYNVILTAQRRNCTVSADTLASQISIEGPILDTALVDISKTATCVDDPNIMFSAAGESINTYIWVTGKGDTITNVTGADTDTIMVDYLVEGVYYPQLIVVDLFGCERLFELDSIVVTNPAASLTVSPLTGCEPLTVTLDGSASRFASTYTWDAPGSFTLSGANTAIQTIRYNNFGTYSGIRLTITDAISGCSTDTLWTDSIIVSNAEALFSMDTTTGCVPLTVNFTNLSTTYKDSIVGYQWNFGDPTTNTDTSSALNPSYTYQTASNNSVYTVSLTVTTAKGCTDTYTQTVRPTLPTAQFNPSRTFVCTEQNIFFNNNSSGYQLYYVWDFGDGDSATTNNANHFYANEGAYEVCLTTIDGNGCTDQFCDSITVANPVAGFTANKLVINCPPDTIKFFDNSINTVSWQWFFGDGASSLEENPIHIYRDPGLYTVTLIATSSSGCRDTIVQPNFIDVRGPYGEFSYAPLDSCRDMAVIICSDSLVNTKFVFYESDDNNTTIFFTDPIHPYCFAYTYMNRGTYNPVIEIQDSAGCPRRIDGPTLIVTDPEPVFTIPSDTTCVPFTITPTNASIDAQQGYFWEVSGTGVTISDPTAARPNITFTEAGTYDVTLIVTDRNGCQDSLTKSIVAADITADGVATPNIGCLPLVVNFTDNSNSYPLGATSWFWEFGDGNTSTLQNPTHTYMANGTYTVQLTTTNAFGCSSTNVVDQVTVTFPTIDFSASLLEACTDQSISFTNNSSGVNITALWDFGNGTNNTDFAPTMSYPQEGTYTVSLTITDENNCSITAFETIVIANPKANFGADTTYANCPPATFQFIDSSENAVAWFWDFGDGDTSTLQNPSHTYTVTGFYDVTLIVTSVSGCFDTLVRPQYIEVDGPTGSFSIAPLVGCAPVDITFIANVNKTVQYDWDVFGNGNIITNINNTGTDTLTVTYLNHALYQPVLTISDTTGCALVLTDTTVYIDTLQVNFAASDTFLCQPEMVTFTPIINSSAGIDSVEWWVEGVQTTFNNTNNFTHTFTNTGQYDVMMVVHSGYCIDTMLKTQFIEIIESEPTILSDYNGQDVSCFGATDGQATVNVMYGVPPYSYLWSNGETTNTANNLGAGQHFVTITDSDNCQIVDSVTLTAPQVLTSSTNVISDFNGQDISCNGEDDGQATITIMGGTMPYSYQWSNGDTTTMADTLSAGQYFVSVTDANGCMIVDSITLTEPQPLGSTTAVISDYSGQDISCFGESDGQAQVTVTGGTTAYTYLWTNGETIDVAVNLAAGEQFVTITDANGCTIVDSITLTEPQPLGSTTAITSDYNGENVSCNGADDGQAVVTITGGVQPYSYAWSNSDMMDTANSLTAGQYFVTVTDANGCTIVDSITLTEPPILSSITAVISNYNGSDISCNGENDGQAAVAIMGGVQPYSYNWSNGDMTDTANNLIAGEYFVTITDANGCQIIDSITVTEPMPLGSTTAVTSDYNGQDISCNGENDGQAAVAITGGTAPYNYNWSNSDMTDTANNLTVGQYFVTITDANGCQITDNITLTEPQPLGSTIAVISDYNGVDISCFGGNDGQAQVTVTGGTTNYNYLWSNGETTDIAINLTAGQHFVTVTDANGCEITNTITLTEPQPLSSTTAVTSDYNGQDISCNGENDGQANVIVTGGTAPYSYLWSNSDMIDTANNLTAGQYFVTVTDANGCQIIDSITITEPPVLSSTTTVLSNYSGQAISCNGASDGQVQVTAVGGTTPYTYLWDNGQTLNIASNLSAGTYFVTVTDANGCQSINNITITDPPILTSTTAVISDYNGQNISCNGESDGAASVAIVGGTAPYTYMWSGGVGFTDTVSNLSAGQYFVTATDANGCQIIDSITLTEPPILASTTAVISDFNGQDISCFGANDGQVEVTPTGGTAPYTYIWNDGQTTAIASNLIAGTYTVTVTDINGCTVEDQIVVTEPPLLESMTAVISDYNGQDISCFGASDGQAQVTATGGTMPYTYTWNNGSTSTTPDNLSVGTYTVIITDINGCQTQNQVTLTQPERLQAVLDTTSAACDGTCDGSIDLIVTGGTTPNSYSWNTGSTTEDLNNLCGDFYEVLVTDANSCQITDSVHLNGRPELDITLETPTCNGLNDGSLTFIASLGRQPYRSSLNNAAFGSTAEWAGLSAGDYNLAIVDDRGCRVDTNFTATEPELLTLNIGPDTTIEFGVSVELYGIHNGVAPFEYFWTPFDSLECDSCLTTIATPLQSTFYELEVIDNNGCSATDARWVHVKKDFGFFAANGFTPNDDGANDKFYIQGDETVVSVRYLRVFDRWGELVFESTMTAPNDDTTGWDGTFKEQDMQSGIYVWVAEIEFIDGSVEKVTGDIMLIR